jgi:3-oxosteroid 1-dehydrogenase
VSDADFQQETDVIVIGSGAAGLVCALVAAVGGLRVVVLEKSDKLGGTSAMSGGAVWVPANHHGRAAGVADSPAEALTYLRATAPEGWHNAEDALWAAFAEASGPMLEFVEAYTPLRFSLTPEADVWLDAPGAKQFGRMVSPGLLPKSLMGPHAKRLRTSTHPMIFTYQEHIAFDVFRHPARSLLRLGPRLLSRWLRGSRGKGAALIIGLVRACLEHGCTLLAGSRAVELTADTEGSGVTGVVLEQNGARAAITARVGVLLASGGFEWDAERLARHFPGPTDRIASPRTNEGDALRLAEPLGAALAHMDQALIYPLLPIRYEGDGHGMPAPFHLDPGAILVNRHGKRFVSEDTLDIGEALDQRDAATGEPLHLPAWLVADPRFLTWVVRWYARFAPGWVKKARTVEELAEKIDLPGTALCETVERYNRFCAQGRDEDFHRGESKFRNKRWEQGKPVMRAIDGPPYIAVPFNRMVIITKGGLRTNERGQVLRQDGSVIAGLFCAGAAMANPIGTRAVSAGTTLGPNMTWGYICARTMLARNTAGSVSTPISLN